MILQIVQHTPAWVWGLLLTLVALGLAHTRTRRVSLGRVTVLPVVLLALSLAGVSNAFGHHPMPLVAWAVGVLLAMNLGRYTVHVRAAAWEARSGRLQVPGSWLPLALIVGLFTIKYVAGVMLAMHPALATNANFALSCSLAFGVFSGLFLARALALRAVAKQPAASLA